MVVEKVDREELYDPVLEELNIISGTLRQLECLLKKQNKIEKMNNILLQKIYNNLSQYETENKIDDCVLEKYTNKNLLILGNSKNEAVSTAKKIPCEIPNVYFLLFAYNR